jgi:hypothetical protein
MMIRALLDISDTHADLAGRSGVAETASRIVVNIINSQARIRPEHPDRQSGWHVIVQDNFEQRSMHLNAAVVFDEAEFAKAIHEEADPGPGGPDHLRQGFLGDLGDQAFRFARHAELRHQEENPGQPLFAGVEKLVHQVSLRAHTPGEGET